MTVNLTSPTPEELAAQTAEAKAIADRFIDALPKFIPLDIPVDKVGVRAAMFEMLGVTRTNVLGATAYVALSAARVGLTRDAIIGIIDAGFDAMKDSEFIQAIADAYTVANAEAQVKAATGKDIVSIN